MIGKKTREHAALICDVVASGEWPAYTTDVAQELGVHLDADAIYLANSARMVAYDGTIRGTAANAAALIRDGWLPGDHVWRKSP